MKQLVRMIMQNPVLLAIIAIVIFVAIPELRIYIAVLTTVLLIFIFGKKGFAVFFGLSALGFFLGFLVNILDPTSTAYQQIAAALAVLNIATLGGFVDYLILIYTDGFLWYQNLLSAIVCGFITVIAIKSN